LASSITVRTLATCSDGRTFANPKAPEHAQESLRQAQRSLDRRKKGSKNREKARPRFFAPQKSGVVARTKPACF
jgi:transposase